MRRRRSQASGGVQAVGLKRHLDARMVKVGDVEKLLELHFIDVGQGDAVLIRSPSGQNVLYDGGRTATVVLDYLRSVGVTSLDLVIASHPDADHIGGLQAVVEAYRPRFYLDDDIVAETDVYQELTTSVRALGIAELEPTARRIGLGAASLQIIPPPGDESLGRNNNSVGVVVTYGDFKVALTGDAEEAEFDWWLENVPELLEPVQVYKSSHHGSTNGDNLRSVTTFGPETIVISVGEGNTYGHTEPETLALISEHQRGHLPHRSERDGHCECHGRRAVHRKCPAERRARGNPDRAA